MSYGRNILAHAVSGRVTKRFVGGRAREIEVERIYPPRGDLEGRDTQALLASLRAVDRAASGWDAPAYWAQRPDFLAELDALLIARVDGKIAGFMGIQWLPRTVYIDATAVVPEHQNDGTATLLIAETAVATFLGYLGFLGFPYAMSLRTENPVVYAAFYRVIGSAMYPQLDGRPPTPAVVAASESVVASLGQADRLDRENLIIRGAHGAREGAGITRPPLPTCRHPEIQSYFDRHVHVDEHDSLLIVIPGTIAEVAGAVRGLLRRSRSAHTRRAGEVRHAG